MLTYKVQPKGAVSPGISTCQGCMIDVIFRNVLDILGDDTVLVVPPGCAAQFSFAPALCLQVAMKSVVVFP